MTLQELKEAIIKDETEFIIEMLTDVGSTLAEVNESLNDMTNEINSYQTPEELMCFYLNRGWKEQDAYNTLFAYLVEN